MASIFLRLAEETKKRLQDKADRVQLSLNSYCRMVLIKSLENKNGEVNEKSKSNSIEQSDTTS
jgi:hypothetical protein